MPKSLKTKYRISNFFVMSITIWHADDNENLLFQNLWNGGATMAALRAME